MKTFTVTTGRYEGRTGSADTSTARNGRVLVMFPGNNMSGAYIKIADLVAG